MRVWFDVRFTVIQCEFKTDDPKFPHVWIRNGRMVIKNRGVKKTGQVRCTVSYETLDRAAQRRTGSGPDEGGPGASEK
jgi:hypothetical protein